MKKYILISLLFYPVFATSLLQTLDTADEKFRTKSYYDALKLYQEVLAQKPNSVRALSGIANTSEILGYHNKAISAYGKILELQPENIQAVTGKARILAETGKHQEALRTIAPHLEKFPQNQALVFTKAYIYLKENKYRNVIHLLQNMSKRYEAGEFAKNMLATAYAGIGQFDQALSLLEEIISQNPENHNLFINQGQIYLMKYDTTAETGLIHSSIQSMETAFSILPQSVEARNSLLRLYIYTGAFDKCIPLLKSLLQNFPNDSQLHFFAGYIYQKSSDISSAIRHYKKAITLDELDESGRLLAESFALENLKENHDFRTSLGYYRYSQFLRNKKQYMYGNSFFNLLRARKLIPENNKVKFSLLDFYYKTGRIEAYINLLIQLRNERPDDYKIKNQLKTAVQELKKTIVYEQNLVTINPDEVKINYKRTPTIVYLYDFATKPFYLSYPDASAFFTAAVKDYLLHFQEFKIYSGPAMPVAKEPYTNGGYYTLENLKNLKQQHPSVHYTLHGRGQFKNNEIRLKLDIIQNKNETSINTFSIQDQDRDSVAIIANSIAKRLQNLEYNGKIIAMDSRQIVINSGLIDGLQKNEIITIFREGKEIGKAKIVKIEKYISIAEPVSNNFFRVCKTGDRILKYKKNK